MSQQVKLSDIVTPFLLNSLTTLLSIHLYPSNLFFPTSWLGISPMVCRHPEVRSYLNDSVEVAGKGVGDGAIKAVVLEFFDEKGVLER